MVQLRLLDKVSFNLSNPMEEIKVGEKISEKFVTKKWYWLILVIVAFSAGIFIFWFWRETVRFEKSVLLTSGIFTSAKDDPAVLLKKRKDKPRPVTVKAIYLTAYSAGSQKKLAEIIDLIDQTELNAVVIDIKDYSGFVLYDTQVPLAVTLKLKDDRLGDVRAMIKKLHEHGIYVIARQTVFQDPILAQKKPEWAILDKRYETEDKHVWRDHKGLSWVDGSEKNVWDYNIAIAKEAISLGFDEINFDYVRFPSDGAIANMRLHTENKTKHDIMREFYETLGVELANQPAKISVDLFGFVMEKVGKDDMNIGQRLVDAVDNVDAVAPMMYPSHYPSGHLGFANPADHPGEVLENGLKMGAPTFVDKRAKLRPWIQAFNMGAVYDATKIRAQIDMVEKYTIGGWMLWNASNRYTSDGLKLETGDIVEIGDSD